MDLSKIPVGVNPPYDVNAIIEIPQGGEPVKYELDKESGAIMVDRFLHTAMYYPGNYGFIPHTLSDDGDPMDVLVVGPTPVVPGAVIRVRPIGTLMMVDEAGGDEKILAVPVDKLHPFYTGVESWRSLPAILTLAEAKDKFQRDYINEILAINAGNRTKTARDLGVDPRTIFRHLEKEAGAAEGSYDEGGAE